MKTVHLSIIVILVIGISFVIDENAYAICTYCPLTPSPTIVPPSLATINTTINTTNGYLIITGTVYKLFSNVIVLKIQDPQENLIAVSQLQPATDGTFSINILPSHPLWSLKGNYTVTIASGSQQLGETKFYYDGAKPCCITASPSHVDSPLKQFKSGISAKDVICKQELQLILKLEDDSPACVNPYVALRLAKIGWTASNGSELQQLPDPSSALKLNLSANPSSIHPREFVEIKISVNNTLQNPIYVESQHKWAYENVVTICGKIRLGIAILDGYYTANNMTEGKSLQLFNKYECGSADLETGKVYEFQAQSNQVKEIMCYRYFGNPCPSSEYLNMNYGFDGYWDKNNTKQSFKTGNYTVIGADEWGHLAIQHFAVINSSTIYETSISQPIIVDTNDVRGTAKYIVTNTPLTELGSSSTGIELARGRCCDSYDHDNIKLELYHGRTSDSHIIAATVENLGKRTAHIYGIHISGFIQITNSSTSLNLVVIQANSNIIPIENAILEPGESQTKYIIGNWTMMGKPVTGFSAGTSYSYDDLENYNGMTNGFDMSIPVQWIQQ